ncbi:MAG: T9SS type A sorting domain-containing protein [Ignavibacteriaceae bacterium]|nr:T9SS type A sorting domain-containing protein [Ignavibacteriaceae bacterium]
MKYSLLLLLLGIILLIIPANISQPSFNGANPGCSGSGCHSLQDGIVSVSVNDLQLQITLSGTSSKVAGELVDSNGTVVAFNNSTSSNPFTLSAPSAGLYRVNAGYKNPSLRWDSSMISITTVTNINENELNPTAFKLYDNYPNPFNPSTTLRYSIPEASFTTLKVYDELGKEVATLVNETKSAGTYEVEFSAKDLASGIYYYTLQAGSFSKTNKMILMK